MRPFLAPALALTGLLACPLAAADFPPIPADVWSMKADPAKPETSAVVLDELVKFTAFGIQHRMRIRVLAEAGKSAAEFSAFPSNVTDLRGRTVLPDGKVTPFEGSKDFQSKRVFKQGSRDVKVTKLMVPGLTANCLVDIEWTEPRNYKTMWFFSDNANEVFRLINPWPTKRMTVELPGNFPQAYYPIEHPTVKMKVERNSRQTTFTWTDLPAEESIPYALQVTRPAPQLMVFYIPEGVEKRGDNSIEGFWQRFGLRVPYEYFSVSVSKGINYKAFAEEVTKGLPTTPHAAATELMLRVQERIAQMGALSPQELEKHAFILANQAQFNIRDLSVAIREKAAPGWALHFLTYALLRDLGLKPQFLMVCDRDWQLIDWRQRNPGQWSSFLVGVEEAGKGFLWIDARLRFLQPGIIHPDYQGVSALRFDPAQDWRAFPMDLDTQPAALNQRRYTFKLDLQEEEDRFELNTEFQGYPAYQERDRFLRLVPAEQERILKERLENSNRTWSVDKATVKHLMQPRNPMGWKVEGRVEAASGRRREVRPFPMMPNPLWVPDVLPPTREDLIVLPYAFVHEATSGFKVPSGMKALPAAPFERRNAFGKVSWRVQAGSEPDTLQATLRVELENPVQGPEQYAALKEFLGWIQEATQRTVLLEKS